jgi:FHA domain
VALNSGDIRWLMPALFSLTPGFSGTQLDLQPDMLITAEMLEFVQRTKDPVSGADELVYLEPAIALGSEFATSWMWGLGLSVELLAASGTTAFAREFLAPTAITNHLFSVTKGPEDLDLFTHCVLTLDEYHQHLAGLLEQAAAKALEPIPVPVPEPPAPSLPTASLPVAEPTVLNMPRPSIPVPPPPVQSLPPQPLPIPEPPVQSLPETPAPIAPAASVQSLEQMVAPAGGVSPSDVTLVRSRSAAPLPVDGFMLTLIFGERRIALTGPFRLGREADNELILPGEKVAPHHAIIQRGGLVYKIIDLNTASGTSVNGNRISAPTLLKSGDIIFIGDTQLSISD